MGGGCQWAQSIGPRIARVGSEVRLATILAPLNMISERGRSAGLDHFRYLSLVVGQPVTLSSTKSA
jgi:hypothetical protein